MNEQLVLSIADNIIWLVLFCMAGGIMIGWYITFEHYHQKEIKREAIEEYKAEKLPQTGMEKIAEAEKILQTYVTRYHIEWGLTHWDYDADVKEEET